MKKEVKLFENLPEEYYSIDKPKQHIAKSIKYKIDRNGLSLRKLSDKINGLSYTQIQRITSQQNYNINTLLKVLDGLGLEIEIKEKSKNQ